VRSVVVVMVEVRPQDAFEVASVDDWDPVVGIPGEGSRRDAQRLQTPAAPEAARCGFGVGWFDPRCRALLPASEDRRSSSRAIAIGRFGTSELTHRRRTSAGVSGLSAWVLPNGDAHSAQGNLSRFVAIPVMFRLRADNVLELLSVATAPPSRLRGRVGARACRERLPPGCLAQIPSPLVVFADQVRDVPLRPGEDTSPLRMFRG
jgi:hypothetical protein